MTNAPRVQSKWPIPLTDVKCDRRVRRSSVAPQVLSDITGIDGNYEGGLRPHAGFELAHELDFAGDINHDSRSKILDFYPINFSIGSDYYAVGFVYRAQRSGSTSNSDIFIDYWNSKTNAWSSVAGVATSLVMDVEDLGAGTPVYDGSTAGLPIVNTDINSPMDVTVFGQFVYVGVRGRPMAMFFVIDNLNKYEVTANSTPNTGGTYTISVEAPNHPTVKDIQTTADIAYNAGPAAVLVALELLTNVSAQDIQLTATGGTDLGVAGTVFTFLLTGQLKKSSVRFTINTANLTGGINPVTVQGFLEEHFAGKDLTNGPLTGPGLAPKMQGYLEWDSANPPSFGETFPTLGTRRSAEATLWLSSSPPSNFDGTIQTPDLALNSQEEEPVLLKPGDYAFAISFVDSLTGRKSALSELSAQREGNFSTADRYAIIEIAYDSAVYDQAWVYRSVRVQDAGGTYVAKIVHLDRIIDLADFHTSRNINNGIELPTASGNWYYNIGPLVTNTPISTWRHAMYWYTREDKVLAWQESYQDFAVFDADMPKAGALHMYEGVLLVSNILGIESSSSESTRPREEQRNISELRWSSLTEFSPELYTPADRYQTKTPANTIIKMEDAGSNVIGFSQDRQYHTRTEGMFIKVQEIHKGYGIVGPWASISVANQIYFLSERGLKTVASNGQLDDIKVFNMDILEEWKDELDNCSISLDAASGLMVILNPTQGISLNIWFNSGIVSRDIDLPFYKVCEGAWFKDQSVPMTSSLLSRSFFLQNSPDIAQVLSGWAPRIYVSDYNRTKGKQSLLDPGEDLRFALLQTVGSDNVMHAEAGTVLVAAGTNRVHGCWVYCIKSDGTTLGDSFVGKKAQVLSLYNLDSSKLQLDTRGELVGVPIGNRFALSPVHFSFVTSRLWATSAQGQPFSRNMAHNTQVNNVDIVCTRASGTALSDGDAIMTTSIYEGDLDLAISGGKARSIIREGTIAEGLDVSVAGTGRRSGVAGVNLSVGCQVSCADLDFVVLSVTAYGMMRSETSNGI